MRDEGCDCPDGTTQPCYGGPDGTEGVGACRGGTQDCSDGTWKDTCEGDVTPSLEQCNGVDDDCDGDTDCGEDSDCDGALAPPTPFGEVSCTCLAALGSCDQDESCATCHHTAGSYQWCRKIDPDGDICPNAQPEWSCAG